MLDELIVMIKPMIDRTTWMTMNHALMLTSCKRLAYNAIDGTILARQNNRNAMPIITANGFAIADNIITANDTSK